MTSLSTTHYLVGSATGHPFPIIVRDYIIGHEIKAQFADATRKLPDVVIACVRGGSNVIGTFYNLIDELGVQLIGIEAGGEGIVYFGTDSTKVLMAQTPCYGSTSYH